MRITKLSGCKGAGKKSFICLVIYICAEFNLKVYISCNCGLLLGFVIKYKTTRNNFAACLLSQLNEINDKRKKIQSFKDIYTSI